MMQLFLKRIPILQWVIYFISIYENLLNNPLTTVILEEKWFLLSKIYYFLPYAALTQIWYSHVEMQFYYIIQYTLLRFFSNYNS